MTLNDRGDLNLVRRIELIIAGGAAVAISLFVSFVNAPEMKAQSQATERLAFEVASVKPDKWLSNPKQAIQAMTLQYLPGGRFAARSVPIPILIFEAYSVTPASGRIKLTPDLEKSMDRKMESETYDIDAVAEKGAIPANLSPTLQRERIRLMLQTLLADRFKVRIRRETKEVPVYDMVVEKNGAKLQKSNMNDAQCTTASTNKPQAIRLMAPTDSASCHSFAGAPRIGLRGEAIDMSDLAAIVQQFSDRPVLDHTALLGLYKITIPAFEFREPPLEKGSEPTPENLPADLGRPRLSELLQDLGLRLESTRAQVEMFVVEHFERLTQN